MISAFLYSPGDIDQSKSKQFDIVHISCIPFLCGEPLPDRSRSSKRSFPKLLLSFPFISKGKAYRLFCERFEEFAQCFDGFTIQNIGDYGTLCELINDSKTVRREDLFIAGDIALNITNTASANYWHGKLDSAAILPELSLAEQKELALKYPPELIPETVASKKTVVMRSEHCYAAKGASYHCGKCGRSGLLGGSIFDINGREFPIVTNPIDCNSILLCTRHDTPCSEALSLDLTSKTLITRVQ